MPIKRLSSVEQTWTLFVHHPYSGITRIVNNFDIIPVCLLIIRRESLEDGFNIPMFEHYLVELCPHNLLCFYVFGLHVANYNGRDFVISNHKHDRSLLSNQWFVLHCETWSMSSLDHPLAAFMQQGQLCSEPHQWTSWRKKPSNHIFGLGRNILGWNRNNFYISIQGYC
jgi:hypothetical protein